MTGNFELGRVIKNTSRHFKDIEAHETYIYQIQLKYDGDDVVFIVYLIDFQILPIEKMKRTGYGRGSAFLYIFEGTNCFRLIKK